MHTRPLRRRLYQMGDMDECDAPTSSRTCMPVRRPMDDQGGGRFDGSFGAMLSSGDRQCRIGARKTECVCKGMYSQTTSMSSRCFALLVLTGVGARAGRSLSGTNNPRRLGVRQRRRPTMIATGVMYVGTVQYLSDGFCALRRSVCVEGKRKRTRDDTYILDFP